MNNQDYISHLAESKAIYHTQKAKVPFEEKLKIIIELQKLEMEMIKRNKSRKTAKNSDKCGHVICDKNRDKIVTRPISGKHMSRFFVTRHVLPG
jgi:hypothetical protein